MAVSHMLALDESRAIAERVAREHLPPLSLDHAEVQPTVNSIGEGALRVVYVLQPDAPDRIRGEDLLKLLVDLRVQLETAGEERAPIVEYATTDELSQTDDD